MREKRGFTLVELLVVIAIIALLMSILMPALTRTKKQAQAVLDISNLKQMGICFSMYTNDWDGSFMAGWITDGAVDVALKTDYWMGALQKYYGEEGDLRLCPSATKPGTEAGWTQFGGVAPDSTFYAWGIFDEAWDRVIPGHYGSYEMNSWCNNPRVRQDWIDHDKYNWDTISQKGADNIPLLGDGQWVDCWPFDSDEPPEYSGQPWGHVPSQMARCCIDRHNGFVNWVFMDASARKVGLKEMWCLKWSRRFDTNYPPPVWPEWMKTFKNYK